MSLRLSTYMIAVLAFAFYAICNAGNDLDTEDAEEKKVRELMAEEVSAIVQKNCSVVYMDHGEEDDSEVLNYHCQIALWFRGEYPDWFATTDFVQMIETATEENLNSLAEQVCSCRILDINDLCPMEVKIAAQKIIDRCPRNTVITGLSRQGRKYFD